MHLVCHVISRDGSNLLLDVNYLLLCHRLAGSSQPVLNVAHNDSLICILLMESPNFTKIGASGHQDSLSKHAKSRSFTAIGGAIM